MKYFFRNLFSKYFARIINAERGIALSARFKYPLVSPISTSINITKDCNSKCQYCLSWKIKDAPQPTTDEVISILDSMAHLGIRRVAFSGGEPLLRKDLESLILHASQRGISVNVLTNGLLATKERISRLVDAGMYYLTLSMDSSIPEIYTYLRGVPYELFSTRLHECILVREKNPRLFLSVHCVINKINLKSIPELVKYLDVQKIGTSFQIIHPIFNSLGQSQNSDLYLTKEDLPDIRELIYQIETMKQQGYKIRTSHYYLKNIPLYVAEHRLPTNHRCLAGYSNLGIDNNLNLYACWPMTPVGNLRKASLEKIWYSKEYQQIRSRMWSTDCPKCWLSCHAELGPLARKCESKHYKITFRR